MLVLLSDVHAVSSPILLDTLLAGSAQVGVREWRARIVALDSGRKRTTAGHVVMTRVEHTLQLDNVHKVFRVETGPYLQLQLSAIRSCMRAPARQQRFDQEERRHAKAGCLILHHNNARCAIEGSARNRTLLFSMPHELQ